MAYSDKVIDHYENPRNVGKFDDSDESIGTGMVGAPACGDVMRLQIKVNAEGVIEDAKFKTYGCGSAIASSSLLTEWVKGKKLEGKAQVNAIVDRDKVEPRAEKIAIRTSDKPRKAITLLKRSLGYKRRRLFEEARTMESFMHEICFADPETQARIRENYND